MKHIFEQHFSALLTVQIKNQRNVCQEERGEKANGEKGEKVTDGREPDACGSGFARISPLGKLSQTQTISREEMKNDKRRQFPKYLISIPVFRPR